MDKTKLKEIYNRIKAYDKVIILPHGRPDGDCIGSAIGLKEIIKTSFPDKAVYVSGEISEFTSFIGTLDTIEDETFKDALVIAVDTANKNRIADQRYEQGAYLIKIDHHIPVDDYGNMQYVDTTRPAAALIILDLFYMFQDELSISEKGIQALYTGILTDTGRFKYEGVDGDTFRRVAMLYDMGLKPQKVYAHIDTKSEALVRFKGYVLLNYQKTANGLAYIKITHELCDEYDVSIDEAASLVNELSVFEDCPVWALFAEYEEKIVRGRLRSKGPVVNEVANQFDGGGHPMASGVNLGTWDRADEIIKALDQLAKDYKSQLD